MVVEMPPLARETKHPRAPGAVASPAKGLPRLVALGGAESGRVEMPIPAARGEHQAGLSCYISYVVLLREPEVAELLVTTGMTQVELAAALNTTQAAVSQWVRSARRPGPEVLASIDRALRAGEIEGRYIDAGLWRGPIRIPARLWEPAFRPSGRFRLPLRLEWSGSDRSRWRDASDLDSLLTAYLQVMVEGSVADIVTWVDPKVLADNVGRVLWPRRYEPPWCEALTGWGLLEATDHQE